MAKVIRAKCSGCMVVSGLLEGVPVCRHDSKIVVAAANEQPKMTNPAVAGGASTIRGACHRLIPRPASEEVFQARRYLAAVERERA